MTKKADPLVAPVVGGTPEELIQRWRARAARLRENDHYVDDAMATEREECANELAALVPRPEPREQDSWIPKCKYCHRAITRIDLPAPEGPDMKGQHGWIHVSPIGVFCPPSQNEQGELEQWSVEPEDSIICRQWETLNAQRAKAEAELDAVRPASAPSLELEKADRQVYEANHDRDVWQKAFREEREKLRIAETRIAQLEAASAPSRPLEEQEEPEDVALKVEVIREYDGRFAASWERGNEGGMAAYSGTVVGALAELCASLIRVDEDNAHAPLRVLVPGGDPQEK